MEIIGIAYSIPMPVPLLARAVPAGFSSPADDFIEDEIDLQQLLISSRPATFLVGSLDSTKTSLGRRRSPW